MSSNWQDKIIDHAIEKAQVLRAQLQSPERSWEDQYIGLDRSASLVFSDQTLPDEFREELAGLLHTIYHMARTNGPAKQHEDLWFLVESAQRVGRVIRESEGRLNE